MPEKQELSRGTCRKAYAKQCTRETMSPYLSRFYYKVATGSRIRFDTSSMRQNDKNSALHINYRKDFGRGTSKDV